MKGGAVRVRPMGEGDLDWVMAIAAGLKDAPHWPREAYVTALRPDAMPRRIALVAVVDTGFEDLNGHGLSRAAKQTEASPALAAEGMPVAESTFPQGLEPGPVKTPGGSDGPADLHAPLPEGEQTTSWRTAGFLVASLVAPQAELESIAVAVAEQGQGIGRALLRALAEELKKSGVDEVLLEVRASNLRALGFYRKLGWSETGRRPRYYAEPEEDAVLMNWDLD